MSIPQRGCCWPRSPDLLAADIRNEYSTSITDAHRIEYSEAMVLGRSKTFKPNLLARLFTQVVWRLTISPARTGRIQLVTDDLRDIDCFDLASIQTSKGFLWHSVELRSPGRADILSGLTASGAEALATALHDFANVHFAIVIENDRDRLTQVGELLQSTVREARRYLSHSDLGAIIAKVSSPAAAALAHPLFDRSRLPDRTADILPASLAILTDPEERHRYNEAFVVSELHRFRRFFDDVSGFSLSDEQREASVRLEDNNLLIASAGSGKTATMVAKIGYLLEKKLVPATEVLVLAFNNDAADELRERIARNQGVADDELECHVSTFHALGRKIIRTVDGKPPQLANWVENAAAEARFFQGLVDCGFRREAGRHSDQLPATIPI